MKVLILMTLFAMVSMANAEYSCPQFWSLFDGSCYRYLGEREIWTAAEARCNEFFSTSGIGHLTSIHSDEENRFVYELFRTVVEVDDVDWNSGHDVWIGLHQAVENGLWVNTDGSAQGPFENWRKDEPSNSGQREDCVHIWRRDVASETLQEWNDEYCEEEMSFVCKMPADGAASE